MTRLDKTGIKYRLTGSFKFILRLSWTRITGADWNFKTVKLRLRIQNGVNYQFISKENLRKRIASDFEKLYYIHHKKKLSYTNRVSPEPYTS